MQNNLVFAGNWDSGLKFNQERVTELLRAMPIEIMVGEDTGRDSLGNFPDVHVCVRPQCVTMEPFAHEFRREPLNASLSVKTGRNIHVYGDLLGARILDGKPTGRGQGSITVPTHVWEFQGGVRIRYVCGNIDAGGGQVDLDYFTRGPAPAYHFSLEAPHDVLRFHPRSPNPDSSITHRIPFGSGQVVYDDGIQRLVRRPGKKKLGPQFFGQR